MDLKHAEAVADEAVRDAVAAVKSHPAYAQIVEKLAGDALRAVAESAGVPI